MGRATLTEQQTSRNKTVKCRLQFCLRLAHDRSQQRMGELASDRCPDLRQLFGGAESIEPRQQRCVQARGDPQGGRRNRGDSPPSFDLAFRLKHRLGHLLYEQRNPVGALQDFRHHVRRELLVSDQPRDDSGHFIRSPSRLSVTLVTCEFSTHGALNSGRKVTMSSAGRVFIRSTVRFNNSRLVGSIQCASSKIIRTGCRRCQFGCLCGQGFQRSLPALLRGKIEHGIASIVRERQHLGKERGILL